VVVAIFVRRGRPCTMDRPQPPDESVPRRHNVYGPLISRGYNRRAGGTAVLPASRGGACSHELTSLGGPCRQADDIIAVMSNYPKGRTFLVEPN